MRTAATILMATLLATSGYCATLARPSQPSLKPSLKLNVEAGRPVIDGVFLNGLGPYRFVLDTGSQTNQMETGLAKKLGLAATLQLDLKTPSGLSSVRGGKVARVSLGPVEAADQEFLFTSFDGLHAQSPDVQGILGQAFLARFDYTLDFQHHLLTFGNSPAVGAHTRVKVVDGCMTVPTNQGELMLDSGADTLILFRRPSRPSSSPSQGRVSTATGQSAAVSLETAPELRIGDQRYHADNAGFLTVAEAPAAGLLPATLFHAVYVSNSEGYVVFNPSTR